MSKARENVKLKWHPAFYSAAEFDFRKEKSLLEFYPEYQLSKEPLAMDLLIIEKQANVELDNEIGKIFRRYNIIEYKSPEDGLNIDDFYKTIGYAALFKGTAPTVNKYPAEELTVSLFRERTPVKLMKQLREKGMQLDKRYPGVYYIVGNTLFPVQLVVTQELTVELHTAMKVLSNNVKQEEARLFLQDAEAAKQETSNIDAILQVSVNANEGVYEAIRREHPMCEALRRLMREDLEAAEYRGRLEGKAEGRLEGKAEGILEGEAKGRLDGKLEGIIEGKLEGKLWMLLELVKDNALSVKEAAKRANLTEAEFIEKLTSNSLS